MKRRFVLAATALMIGCPSSTPIPRVPVAPVDTALRIQIAQAEARRSGGVAELVDLATHGEPHARALALRALGRIGGAQARTALTDAIMDPDPEIAATAIGAIGVAGSLDDISVDDANAVGPQLVRAMDSPRLAKIRWRDAHRFVDRGADDANQRAAVAGIEALGRAGGASIQDQLAAAASSKDAVLAEAAALALARHGRRKLELASTSRNALAMLAQDPARAVRYAAVYALAREQLAKDAPRDTAVETVLAARIADDDPETRAQAIAGLARRGALDAARKSIEDSLLDRDWRVAVEAVRALAGEHGDDAGRDATSAAILRRWTELVRGDAAEAQVITEALRLLSGHAERPLVAAALTALATAAAGAPAVAPLTRGWIECLAIAAIERAHPQPAIEAIATCGHDNLSDHLRLPLLADLVSAGSGDPSSRRAALRILLGHADPRVRAAGLGVLAATWKDGDAGDHANVVATLVSAIGAKDPIVAGSAVDAAPDLYDAIAGGADKTVLDAAVVARARSEREVELSASLYALIGKRVIPTGADACHAGLAGPPSRARAAAECLRALGEAASLPPAVPAEPPPVDVASVINHKLRWHLVTTRGEIVIELRPDVAPWNVATIVALTRKGYYDGLELHRVVPNFVVQGGDPTMSGWGGPGFTTPAEPGTALDGGGFDVGGVGIADAGRDSGGSQWFIMHSRAAHLDGRYTWIGTVASGQKSADALLIGDRVVKATIETVERD